MTNIHSVGRRECFPSHSVTNGSQSKTELFKQPVSIMTNRPFLWSERRFFIEYWSPRWQKNLLKQGILENAEIEKSLQYQIDGSPCVKIPSGSARARLFASVSVANLVDKTYLVDKFFNMLFCLSIFDRELTIFKAWLTHYLTETAILFTIFVNQVSAWLTKILIFQNVSY